MCLGDIVRLRMYPFVLSVYLTWNYQCLLAYIIQLCNCVFLTRIDIYEFLTHVESGLTDHYDIKMLTYLMIARLANMCPSAVLERE